MCGAYPVWYTNPHGPHDLQLESKRSSHSKCTNGSHRSVERNNTGVIWRMVQKKRKKLFIIKFTQNHNFVQAYIEGWRRSIIHFCSPKEIANWVSFLLLLLTAFILIKVRILLHWNKIFHLNLVIVSYLLYFINFSFNLNHLATVKVIILFNKINFIFRFNSFNFIIVIFMLFFMKENYSVFSK